MKKRRFPIAALLLCLCLFLSACGGTARGELNYAEADFCARLFGNRGGTDFSCEAVCRNGALVSLSYTAPDSLSGITLTREGEGYRVSLGERSYSLSAEALRGLLAPAHALLPPAPKVLSVQKTGKERVVSLTTSAFDSPLSVTLSSNGFPRLISVGEMIVQVEKIG